MTLLICNEIVRMDGTFVTSVQHLDADAKKGGGGIVGVSHQCFHFVTRSAYGPTNAKCVTIRSCKGFVYLYMIMGKINH